MLIQRCSCGFNTDLAGDEMNTFEVCERELLFVLGLYTL